MKPYLKLFQSVRFNIGLFAALALASILGTLIPQEAEAPEKAQAFLAHWPHGGGILKGAGFFHVYYSWWFVGMLGLMAFDVIVCKLIFGKFPGLHTFKKVEQSPAVALHQPFKSEQKGPAPLAKAAARVEDLLRRRGYAFTLKYNADGSLLYLGGRHRLQRYGSWISHVSILVILLASFTGALYGFREVVNVPEGAARRLQNRPWTVACDRFTVDWYPGTATPRTFASELRLFVKGELARQEKILVNQPLQYRKVRFYQASYGPYLKEARIGFFLKKHPKESPVVTVRLDEDTPVPGTPYSLRILQFVPDFSMNESREIVTRSAQPQNPALQILVSERGKPVQAPWIFENYPGLEMPPIERHDDYILILAEYVPSFYTGLQVTYDPGADLFWLGCSILVLGLMALFYLNHRKLWVLLQPDAEGTTMKLGGFSSRGKSFEAEFLGLADQLRATLT